ncbi:MAG TPA: DUF433 domain-containing protein [Ktedonobacterales bacterium]|jgi:hypothetical protein
MSERDEQKQENGQHSAEPPSIIRRSDMGLAVSGTRITLYTIMDYLKDGWSHEQILTVLPLTEAQLQAAIDYIAAHREDVEAEYEEVVRTDEEQHRYWEQRLEEHLASQPEAPPSAEKAAFYAKLAGIRQKRILELEERIQALEQALKTAGNGAASTAEASHS